MKRLLLAVLFFTGSLHSYAQSEDRFGQMAYNPRAYDVVIAQFQKYYNSMQKDSIPDLYSDEWGEQKDRLWDKKTMKKLHKKYGSMRSYTYIGEMDDKSASLYKVVFSKSTHAMGILLDKEGKLLNFRFNTSSDHIDNLMKTAR